MAITELPLTSALDLDGAWKLLVSSPLDAQGCEEVRDCWDAVLIWHDWFTTRFGEIQSVRHRSPPDDPPDVELVLPTESLPLEHTRLQPNPLGWAEGLRKSIDPSATTTVPSISRPPQNRAEMIDVMLGVNPAAAWSDVIDDLRVIQTSLATTLSRKIKALPNGGVIVIANHVQMTTTETTALPTIVSGILNGGTFNDFGRYSLILTSRNNMLQFRSTLFRRGEAPLHRERSGSDIIQHDLASPPGHVKLQ